VSRLRGSDRTGSIGLELADRLDGLGGRLLFVVFWNKFNLEMSYLIEGIRRTGPQVFTPKGWFS
jgi:hypothetical protein